MHPEAIGPHLPLLRAALSEETDGRPLEPRTRAFLESRFLRDLSHVRVHTGRWSALLASRLNARAMSIGRDILFGSGEYDPGTAEGLRLLAHELGHVLQQDGEKGAWLPKSIGRSDDPLEREADLIAEQLLRTAPLPRVSAGPPGVLRRAIKIDFDSAGIDVADGQVKPDGAVEVGSMGDQGAVHLTKGFNRAHPTHSDEAFSFQGHVKVALGPGDSLQGWRFGWVQLGRQNSLGMFYAGRRRSEGSVAILPSRTMTTDYVLDAATSKDPTAPLSVLPFHNVPQFTVESGEVLTKYGDHPAAMADLKMHNFATGVTNFLFQIVDDSDFWTLLTARDKEGHFHHLAHVHWGVHQEVTFNWRNGRAQVAQRGSRFTMGIPAKGAPTDPTIKPTLASVGPTMAPIMNDVLNDALSAALVHPNEARDDNPGWFFNVPADFFR